MFYETSGPHGLPHDPFKSLVVPRPIGWVSTVDADGNVNLAPYSFFNAVASHPPAVMFCGGGQHAEGGLKDSVANAEATGEFVCSLATWALREQMNASSADLPHGADEFEFAGLTPAPSRLVRPPRVAESPAHLECRYLQSVHLPSLDPDSPNTIVIGQVVGVHIDDSVLRDGRVDVARMRPIARLGYMDYTVVDEIFSMARPRVPEPETQR